VSKQVGSRKNLAYIFINNTQRNAGRYIFIIENKNCSVVGRLKITKAKILLKKRDQGS